MTKTLTIDGARIHDIVSLYDEINRVFMADEDWALGPSLDALDDLFYGGYGAVKGSEPVTLVWRDFARMTGVLGLDATRVFLTDKLNHPAQFDAASAIRKLEALETGTGQTYFDIVLEIIAGHPNIRLVPA